MDNQNQKPITPPGEYAGSNQKSEGGAPAPEPTPSSETPAEMPEPEVVTSEPEAPKPEPEVAVPETPSLESGFKGAEIPVKKPAVEVHTMTDDIESQGTTKDTESAPSVSPEDLETGEPVFKPETINQMPGEVVGAKSKNKKIIMFVTIVLGVVALGFLSYFIIYPILFPPIDDLTSNGENVTTPPPVVGGAPDTNTEEATSEPTPPSQLVHVSFFAGAPAATTKIDLDSLSFSGVQFVLKSEANKPITDGLLKELILSKNGSQISFRDYFLLFIEGGDEAADRFIELNQFGDDFTTFFYYDELGAWPGYIVKMNFGVDGDNIMTQLKKVESSFALRSMYPTDPGAFQAFKDGKLDSVPTRYTLSDSPGVAFNYGVFGQYLVFSTSYDGLKNAVPLLEIATDN